MADKSISYSYKNKNHNVAAVKHAFRYLSALTGIQFVENISSPNIMYSDDKAFPETAHLTILKETNNLTKTYIKNNASDNWNPILNYDPVNLIISKLSLRGKSGPYAYKSITPSEPGEQTLSGIIADIHRALCRAGLLEALSRPITLWSAPSKFAMAVTHDIDIPRRTVAGGLRLLYKRDLPGGLGALFDSLKSAAGLSPNPYDAIPRWNELEKDLDIKSTYFIFDGDRRHPLDPKYKPKIIALEKLCQFDSEIALHSGIECFAGNGLAWSKSRLEQAARTDLKGLRPHYLSAYYPEYWQAASDAGFTYSSALGFDQNIGFWDGIDLPFYPFDPLDNCAVDLLEIPVAIMDCGLIGDQSADSERVLERAMRLLDQTAATSGLIVLDWHQRTFYNRDYPGWRDLFTKIVRYGKGKGAQFYRLDELAEIFAKRFRAQS
jgi:hypothetical protein